MRLFALLPVRFAWPPALLRTPVVSYTAVSPSPNACTPGTALLCGTLLSGYPARPLAGTVALWRADFPQRRYATPRSSGLPERSAIIADAARSPRLPGRETLPLSILGLLLLTAGRTPKMPQQAADLQPCSGFGPSAAGAFTPWRDCTPHGAAPDTPRTAPPPSRYSGPDISGSAGAAGFPSMSSSTRCRRPDTARSRQSG